MSYLPGTSKSGDTVLASDIGNTVLTVRQDSDVASADNGEYAPLVTDNTGALKVNATNTVTIQGVQDASTTDSITSASTTIGPLNVNQRNVLNITIGGTYAGVSFIVESSPDQNKWGPIQTVDIATSRAMSTWTPVDNQTLQLECALGAHSYIRVRALTWTSGSADVIISAQSFAYEPIPTSMYQPIEVDMTSTPASANNTNLFSVDATGMRHVLVQLSGTWVGTVTFQGSNDNVTFNSTVAVNASTGVQATTSTTNANFVIPVRTKYIRARTTAYTSGSVTGTYRLSSAEPTSLGSTQPVSGTVSVTGYPTAAAAADAYANPTVTHIAADQMNFNGATWDRSRNNITVTMGDTGAKTATFNGATQTNFNARGAYITVAVSAASGTTPTLAAQLQVSYDGTNFLNLGPASGTLTAAGQTSGATPANLTSGATQFVPINAPLPRTWRLAYTIAGTTPSFTFTNAYART